MSAMMVKTIAAIGSTMIVDDLDQVAPAAGILERVGRVRDRRIRR